jgi:hypothetical protein
VPEPRPAPASGPPAARDARQIRPDARRLCVTRPAAARAVTRAVALQPLLEVSPAEAIPDRVATPAAGVLCFALGGGTIRRTGRRLPPRQASTKLRRFSGPARPGPARPGTPLRMRSEASRPGIKSVQPMVQ